MSTWFLDSELSTYLLCVHYWLKAIQLMDIFEQWVPQVYFESHVAYHTETHLLDIPIISFRPITPTTPSSRSFAQAFYCIIIIVTSRAITARN